MHLLSNPEVWFVTGSQHLYGPETLQQVAADSQAIVAGLGAAPRIPLKVVFKGPLTEPCLACHTNQIKQLRENKSKHSTKNCTDCHDVHRKVPQCTQCHKSHSADITAGDCKKGTRITLDGDPYQVVEYSVQTPSARGAATTSPTSSPPCGAARPPT